jgi:hypothetical protein
MFSLITFVLSSCIKVYHHKCVGSRHSFHFYLHWFDVIFYDNPLLSQVVEVGSCHHSSNDTLISPHTVSMY